AKINDLMVVNVKPGYSERALRLLRFFLEADRFAVGVELNHTVTLRVANLIGENASATLDGERVPIEIEFSIENVVAQNERGAGVADEFCADQKRLGDPFRLRLLGVFDSNAELGAIAQVILQHRQILWSRDHKHLAQATKHQGCQRIADHWLV